MKYESLIFDIDGTLWDSRALVAEGYNQQLEKEGLQKYCVTVETLKPLFGKVLPEIADILFYDYPKEKRMDLICRCRDNQDRYLHENPCHIGYPQVLETLQLLSRDHRIFIVSNSEKGYPELCMEKLGIGPFIQDHLCYGDTGTSKGQTIKTLMARHHIENCAYIGDTQGDYQATLEAKIPFIWARYGFGTPEGWTHRIDKIWDLTELT